jgi:environmental stress-induced protein Ves
MQVLRCAGYRRMPWKNGGGETFEIAVSPPEATLDAMDWRISMAVVASDGPFSSFPGVDRTLSILEGDGIELALEGAGAFLLSPGTEPFHFPADVPAMARLSGGAVTDLNVMSRRSAYRHLVRRLPVDAPQLLATKANAVAVFACSGAVACARPGEPPATLQARDCALFRAPPGHIELAGEGPAVVLLAEFYFTTA